MRWLRYLAPFDRFILESDATPSELAARLSARVSAKPIWSLSKPTEPFRGKVSERRFRLHPVIDYRNSFKPVIFGWFETAGVGTRITRWQRPPILALAFMTFWFSCVILTSGVLSVAGQFDWFGATLVLSGVMLLNGGFWYEARHTEGELGHIFRVEERHSVLSS